jgi:hypothetical protein
VKVNKFFFAFAVFFLFCLFFFVLFGVARAQARSLPLNDELLTLNNGAIQSLEPKSGSLLSSLVDAQDLKLLGRDSLNLEGNGLLLGNTNIKNVNSPKNISNMKALLLLQDLNVKNLRLLNAALEV